MQCHAWMVGIAQGFLISVLPQKRCCWRIPNNRGVNCSNNLFFVHQYDHGVGVFSGPVVHDQFPLMFVRFPFLVLRTFLTLLSERQAPRGACREPNLAQDYLFKRPLKALTNFKKTKKRHSPVVPLHSKKQKKK